MYFHLYLGVRSQRHEDGKYYGDLNNFDNFIREREDEITEKFQENDIHTIFFNEDLKEIDMSPITELFVNTPGEPSYEIKQGVSISELEKYYKIMPTRSLTKAEVREILADYGDFEHADANTHKEKFNRMIGEMQKKYQIYPYKANEPKIFIKEDDIHSLSKYEQNVLKSIATIYDILQDPSKDLKYSDLINIMEHLGRHKTDVEKSYLLGKKK